MSLEDVLEQETQLRQRHAQLAMQWQRLSNRMNVVELRIEEAKSVRVSHTKNVTARIYFEFPPKRSSHSMFCPHVFTLHSK